MFFYQKSDIFLCLLHYD